MAIQLQMIPFVIPPVLPIKPVATTIAVIIVIDIIITIHIIATTITIHIIAQTTHSAMALAATIIH
jgi:hypothetical protein